MTYLWSEHATDIVSLYRPWREGDGYSEESIRAAEESLDLRLPVVLRSFYRSWGVRDDLTRSNEYLLPPDELLIRTHALVICVENQAVMYWAIPFEHLNEDDPPVYFADSSAERSLLEGRLELAWELSQERVSDFLDALTFHHAFCRGSAHGGISHERPDERRIALIKQHWQCVEVRSVPFGTSPDAGERRWPLYIRDGQVIDWFQQFFVATRQAEDLDAISQELEITWDKRW